MSHSKNTPHIATYIHWVLSHREQSGWSLSHPDSMVYITSCVLTGWKLTSVPRCLHSAVEWSLQIWWRCCLVHFEDSQPKPCICPETNTEGKAVVRVFTMSNTVWMCSLLLILVRKQAIAFHTIWRETTWVLFLGKSKNNTVNQVWHIKAWTNVWCAFLLSHIMIWHVVCFIVNNC